MILSFDGASVVLLAVKLCAGIFLKAGLVVLAAWLATTISRRESAAFRYAIWSAAIATLIVLPLLSTTFPHFEFAQVPSAPEVAASVPSGDKTASAPPPSTVATKGPGETAASPPSTVAPQSAGAPTVERRRNITGAAYPFAIVFLVLWFAGAGVFILRMVVHALRVGGIVSRATACVDREIQSIVGAAGPDLGLKGYVRLLMSAETAMPFSCGILLPTVVLPATAKNWPFKRKKSVLLHELAHIARWDYSVHILTGVTCAAYWLNPLVWFAARRVAMERERACDDLAVRGTSSTAYAEELLQIARAQIQKMAPVHAVAMATKEDLSERIRSVMSSRVSRNPFPWTGVLIVCFFALVLTLPLAGVELLGIEAKAAKAIGVPTTSSLLSELCDAHGPAARMRAAWWLGEHEDMKAVRTLTKCGLRDDDPGVRLVTAWALGEIKDRDSIDPLIDSLDDPDFHVREMAVLALGEIEDPVAIKPLVQAFDREPDLQHPVIWALGEIEGDVAWRAREAAFEVMDVRPWENEEVWTGALDRVGLLSRIGKCSIKECRMKVTELVDQLDSTSAEDRVAAAYQLGRLGISDCITSTVVIDPLIERLRDPSPEVRAMAVWALDEFNPSRSRHFGNKAD